MDFAASAVLEPSAPVRSPRSANTGNDADSSFDTRFDQLVTADDAPVDGPTPEIVSAEVKQEEPIHEVADGQPVPTVETNAAVLGAFVVQFAKPVVSATPVEAQANDTIKSEDAIQADIESALETAPARTAPIMSVEQGRSTPPQQTGKPEHGASEYGGIAKTTPSAAQSSTVSIPQATMPAPTNAPTPTPQTRTPVLDDDLAISANAPRLTTSPSRAAVKSNTTSSRQEAAAVDQPLKSEPASAATSASAPAHGSAKAGDNSIAPPTVQAPALVDAPAPLPAPIAAATLSPAHAQQISPTTHGDAQTPPAAAQVAREIVRRFDGETAHFELRLDPPELGRVDVRLEVSRDHRVTALVSADNPQALAELARHARDLEQMLQSSGLELTDNGLSFDLRQGGERDAEAAEAGGDRRTASSASEADASHTPMARPLGYERWRGVRVDLMV